MIFIFAQPPLRTQVCALLAESGVPFQDIDDDKIKHVLMCRAEGSLVGVAGMEIRGELGVLRGPAVAKEWRSRGIGSLLLVRMERFAALQGVKRFHGAASAFLAGRGYAPLAAAELSPDLAALPVLAAAAGVVVKPLAAGKVPPSRQIPGHD